MALAHSRLTAQGQISVPAAVRKRLGLAPGALLEWEQRGDEIVVRRSANHTFEDIHKVLFGKEAAKSLTVEDMDQAIKRRMRKKYARR